GITSLSLRSVLKGTRRRTAAEIALETEKLGSSIHFSNDPDYMSFSMSLPSKNLGTGFDILGDVITAPTFPEDELLKEKEDIFAMQLRERDDMLRYPLKIFYSALFGEHPYGLSSIGGEDSIRALDRKAVSRWYFEQLNPEEVLVVLVGDVDSEKVLNLVNSHLGTLSRNGNGRNNHFERTLPTTFVQNAEESDKEQTALVLGFTAPSYLEEEYYSLTVLQNVLSGLGGRLFEELRGRQSLAYTVTTFLVSRLEGGAFVSYIATSPDKEAVAKRGLLKEFEKLQNAPISDEELARAVKYTIGTHQISLETNRAQMLQYAHNEMLGKGLLEITAFPEKISKVTANSILQAARKYFDLDRYALGLVRGKSVNS
ncbi:insulinase family protein, partial [bacterium]|nr:insulinase family protein [bacterium]